MLHEILALEVWGNEEYGFEINDSISTGIFVDIPEDADDKDALILIREALDHDPSAEGYTDNTQCDQDYCFDHAETGEPAYYTRLIRD